MGVPDRRFEGGADRTSESVRLIEQEPFRRQGQFAIGSITLKADSGEPDAKRFRVRDEIAGSALQILPGVQEVESQIA